MKTPWVAFFSQTGAEICDIAESIGRWPDRIITNNRPAHLRTIDSRIPPELIMYTKNNPELFEYIWLLEEYKDPIVTLHGWLRIMPPDICRMFKVFNGHPGLITWYPELKGKDPQIRAYEGIKEGRYEVAGAVLHKVIPEVDEGKIISEEYFNVANLDLDGLFRTLRDRSLSMWINFLKKVL